MKEELNEELKNQAEGLIEWPQKTKETRQLLLISWLLISSALKILRKT